MSRIVMYVYNDARTDSRVLREADSLSAAGHEVTIVARHSVAPAGVGDRELRGAVRIERVPLPRRWRVLETWLRTPWGLRAEWAREVGASLRRLPGSLPTLLFLVLGAIASVPWIFVMLAVRAARPRRGSRRSDLDWLIWWGTTFRAWAVAAAATAPPADVHHGHDLTGLEAAGRARRRGGGQLVYDSHEIFVEAGSVSRRSPFVKAVLRRSERRWAHSAVALVTVNRSIASELGPRLGITRVEVVHNAPERWTPPSPRPDLIRAALGIAEQEGIALYHGGFASHRGIEELAAAILLPRMERVHAVYMGYGSMRSTIDAMAADPIYGGRLHALDAVRPDELPPWVASADVGVVAIQPSTLNHRLSTPNKLFESIAAGVPVVASDFSEMRQIVCGDPLGPLGDVCDPQDPAAIARAIRGIIERPPDEREELRARCLAAADARWNWETEVGGLIRLYADLARQA